MTMPRRLSTYLAVALLAVVAFVGCERTPADVEKWRNAQRRNDKMSKWIGSSNEPMDVRIRSLEILIDEGQVSLVGSTLEEIEDDEALKKLVDAGVAKTQKMWDAQDFPTMDGKKGGKVKVSKSKSVRAKDAAYYLQPYATGESQQQLESILADWLSKDWRLRNKLGKTTLGQLLPRAGSKGIDNAMTWLKESKDPGQVAETLRTKAGDEAKGRIASILLERAEKEHPDLSTSLRNAVLQTRHEKIVPYLEKVVSNPDEGSLKFNDLARTALIEIQGARAAPFLTDLIRKHGGNFRWAVINDLVKLRGKSGMLSAMSALPLERETYDYPNDPDKNFKKDAEWFAAFALGEMIKTDVSSISNGLIQALESERWPAHVLALKCIERAQTCASDAAACGDSKETQKKTQDLIGDNRDKLLEAVEARTSSSEKIPAWGDEYETVGQLAREIADALSTS